MSTPTKRKKARRFQPAVRLVCTLAGLLPLLAGNVRGAEAALVSASVSNGYARARLPDGSFRPETYVLGDGGLFRTTVAGDGIDTLPFRKIADTIAPALAARKYVSATDPQKTDLLIVVSRGSTERLNNNDPGYWEIRKRNAGFLGFVTDMNRHVPLDFTTFARDLRTELEAPRYFVVLQAYDFQAAWKEKKLKLLWETRFSIETQGNNFVESLPLMARQASLVFGRETDGLLRPEDRQSRVDLGELKVIGIEPTK